MSGKFLENFSVKEKLIAILVISAFLFTLAGGLSYNAFTNETRRWVELEVNLTKKQALLHEIQDSLGYAKGIHHFKNMVLRSDVEKGELARKNFEKAIQAIDEFLSMGGAAEQVQYLKSLRATIESYRQKIDLAQELIRHHSSITEVDKKVKIDDTQAEFALNWLNPQLQKETQENREQFLEDLQGTQAQLLSIWLLCFSFLSISLFVLSKSISAKMEEVAKKAEQVAAGDFAIRLDDEVGGELGRYLKSVEKMRISLVESIAKLKASNKDLEQYSYVVSHDLQEPIRKILAFGGRLEKSLGGSIDEESQFSLERILSSATRMRALIDDLLSYARLSNTHKDLAPIDMEKLIRDISLDLDLKIREKEANIQVGALPNIQGDPTRVYQLFSNLILNSLKFSRTEVKPEIKIYANSIENGFVEFQVKDNGIGFSQEYAERIFKPFQRLHNRTEYPGTGIGLAICQKIVEQYGGYIKATSKEGEGTEFRFTLIQREGDGAHGK